jgi:hypothetical protein
VTYRKALVTIEGWIDASEQPAEYPVDVYFSHPDLNDYADVITLPPESIKNFGFIKEPFVPVPGHIYTKKTTSGKFYALWNGQVVWDYGDESPWKFSAVNDSRDDIDEWTDITNA